MSLLLLLVLLASIVHNHGHFNLMRVRYMYASKYTVYRRNKRSLHCCCCFCHCFWGRPGNKHFWTHPNKCRECYDKLLQLSHCYNSHHNCITVMTHFRCCLLASFLIPLFAGHFVVCCFTLCWLSAVCRWLLLSAALSLVGLLFDALLLL